MSIEGAMGDATDFDQVRVLDQIDTFMESQGLRRLDISDNGDERPDKFVTRGGD